MSKVGEFVKKGVERWERGGGEKGESRGEHVRAFYCTVFVPIM